MTFIFDNALIVESKSWTLVHTGIFRRLRKVY